MIFGTTDRFALEVEAWREQFTSILVWVGGKAFGDPQVVSVKSSLDIDLQRFLALVPTHCKNLAATGSADEVKSWFHELVSSEVGTAADAREQDRLIRAMWLFAYAPEGLAGVYTVVGFGDGTVRITAWDDKLQNEPAQVVVTRSEFDSVIEATSRWLGARS